MRITLGIDAALAATGWAALGDDGQLLEYGVIETTANTPLAERIASLRNELRQAIQRVALRDAQPGNILVMNIVIEQTDWSRGRRDDRAAWVREAKARAALGIGFATAVCVSLEFGITPQVLGAREWMAAFGSQSKDDTASLVRLVYPDSFVVKQTALASATPNPSTRRRGAAAMHDRQTDRRVPSHVFDAIALAVVARDRQRLEQMAQASEEPAGETP